MRRRSFKRLFESLGTLVVMAGAPALLWVVIAGTMPTPPMSVQECDRWWLAVLKADQGRR